MISHLRGGGVVGFLDDQQVRDAIDDLMQSAVTSSDRLMTRLMELDWKPNGEAHLTILALMLIVHHYDSLRDQSEDIPDCLVNAYVQTMSHPTISRYMAKIAADRVGGAVME